MVRASGDPARLKGLADLLGVALDVRVECVNCEGELGAEGILPNVSEVQLVEDGLLWVGVAMQSLSLFTLFALPWAILGLLWS